MKKRFLILSLLAASWAASGQDAGTRWADSTLKTMSVTEKIGQLFLLDFPVSQKDWKEMEDQNESIRPGFWRTSSNDVRANADMFNRLQQKSKVPLLFGPSNALRSASAPFFPPIVQSCWASDTLNYQMGRWIAAHLQTAGAGMAFGYFPDLATELSYEQSYGNEKNRAHTKFLTLLHGIRDGGIAVSASPGHDFHGKDSLNVLSLSQLDTVSLSQAWQLIKSGSPALSISLLNFPVEDKDNKKGIPANLSRVFIQDILKHKFGFNGVLFSSVNDMAVSLKKVRRGEPELRAFLAGIDVVRPLNARAAIKRIEKEIKKHPTLVDQLNESIRRVLELKYNAGLSQQVQPINTDNIEQRLNSPDSRLFGQNLAEASAVVVKNSFGHIPIRSLEDKKFLSVVVGLPSSSRTFNSFLRKYAPFDTIYIQPATDTAGLAARMHFADVIVVSIFPEGSGLQKDLIAAFQNLPVEKEVLVCHFGNPLDLTYWQGSASLIYGGTVDARLLNSCAQILFGGQRAVGKLPVTISDELKAGAGVTTSKNDRLSYTVPEAAGMDSRTLELIEPIAQEAIRIKGTPGCRILVARKGKVIYDKAFGFLTYENKAPVTDETIYDMASVTKVSATLQAIMFLQERGIIDINKKISVYLPEFKNTDKENFIIKDILTHQAGLWPFLPFWQQTMKDSTLLPEYYSQEFSYEYPYQVAENLFATRHIRDSMWHWIVHAKIGARNNRTPYTYKYSDMGFYIMQHLAEKMLNQPIEEFAGQNIYEPLGAYSTGFLPRRRFPASRIAPTENDKGWRRSLLTGYVHDQGAALYGGIAGHAGLFSTANDMAKLGQMWLQKGSYGGIVYFKPGTVELFTQKQFDNSRRGLGWDRPVQSDADGPTSVYSSQKTFGHTGFTGTCIWVDPEFELVYIFLSNRVYPDMTNNKILNANIRPRIQDVIYRSIFTYCRDHN